MISGNSYNIAKIIDQWGWSYYFVDVEQQRYSRHNIIIQKHDEVCLDGIDLLYIHGPDINPHTKDTLPAEAKKRGIKVVGGYAGQVKFKYPNVDDIVTISPQTYDYAKEVYPERTILFLPEGIDHEYFVPYERPADRYRVGFAGRLDKVKRPHMLDKLAFPVVKKSDWGTDFFVKDRSLDPMREFYHSIDVLVLTSRSECMPRVILEACACGLPVVSTDVGAVRLILEDEWIAPVFPEQISLTSLNTKLRRLQDSKLRDKVGERNRRHIVEYLSWKVVCPLWDDVFSAIIEDDQGELERISRDVKETYCI